MSVVISDAWRQRFGGTARLYGEKALQCFADAHVCVVGIGGVGSWAAEALARTGIGAITLIDMDDVCVTNTNRQIHALGGNVGLAKAEVMAERIRLINPECRVTVVDDFVTPENVAEYLGVGFSYVIDAIDSVRPKAALIAYCRRHKVPLVTTGGAGGANRSDANSGRRSGENHPGSAGGKAARAFEEPVRGGEEQQR
ncbi:HesA/MoeB/ThiF family protein [Klebsiella grimontii]|uniref:HesA/MoeB/ThiF family protein n=1 Tax=Klebsiella grimontii TaxID=2058152 RepID=A0A7H4NXR2_9ENTR|nr:HesA/MoeB/ThiF family protein [Klebsiella grimontii]